MQQIVEKITKLLSLAEGKGTTPAEAATAAAQAQRLMLKYKIDQHQLDSNGQAEESIEYSMFHRMGKRTSNWKSNLAWGLANLHSCRTLTGVGYIKIVGRKSDQQIVQYLYVYLCREIERLVKEEKHKHKNQTITFGDYQPLDTRSRGKSWYDSFKKGAVQETLDRLEAERDLQVEEVRHTEAGSKALVKIESHDTEVERVTKQHSGGPRYSTGASSNGGWKQGKAAGKTVALNKGMTGAPVKRLT